MADEETATASSTRISLVEHKKTYVEVPPKVADLMMEIHKTTGIKLKLIRETVAKIVFSAPINRTSILALIVGREPIQLNIPGTTNLDEVKKEWEQPGRLEPVEPPQTVTPAIKPPTMRLAKELGLGQGPRPNQG